MAIARLCVLWGLALISVPFVGCTDSARMGEAADSTLAVADTVPSAPVFDIRSVTLDAREPPANKVLVDLRTLGVTHLTFVSFGWQETGDDPHVRLDTTAGWYSESHQGIRALARRAKALGMNVILKPHVWVGGYDEEQSRSEIGFQTEAAWSRWEASYRHFLLTYAKLASKVDADILVLGTELSRPARARPAFWRSLADSVRRVYDGELTYAANWHEEYREIEFWDALDYVGVQAYFPLAEGSQPSLDTLQAHWQSHRRALRRVHRRTDRPVLFTEVGYRSASSAARAPWRWPEEETGVVPDSALQARCYRAFLSTMGSARWFAGAMVWKWHPDAGGRRRSAFTPQGKPAEGVLQRWFAERPARSSGQVAR